MMVGLKVILTSVRGELVEPQNNHTLRPFDKLMAQGERIVLR